MSGERQGLSTLEEVPRRAESGRGSLSEASSEPAVLFEQHYLSLVRLASLWVDDRETAEDVVQDVFAGFQKRRRKGDTDEPLRYLRRAVVNRARSALRRRRTVRAYVVPQPIRRHSAEDSVIAQSTQDGLIDAIARLPARQRDVIVLRYYLDLPIADVAQVLGISSGAVKGSTFKAMGSLKMSLGDDDG